MTDKLVSIFVPAKDEEGNIFPLIEKVQKGFSELNYEYELIIVNDGSTDNTADELKKASEEFSFVRPFHHRRNYGLTEAMRTGFAQVRGDYIVFLPADLESDPEEDIPKLLGKLEEGNDLVTGWRQGRGDGKVIASKVYNVVSRYLFNVKVHDMNWIKAFRREVLDDLELRADWHRFIVMMAANKGYKIDEVSTNWYPRKSGKSKFGLMRFPISMVDVLVVKFNMMFGTKPMRFFSLFGTLLILGGFAGLVFLAFYYFLYTTQIRPLFILFSVTILAGVQLFVTGFLAELVVSQKSLIDNLTKKLDKQKNKSSNE